MVGGASNNEGRVEVYHNNAWGTVCHDSWDFTDATVVCQQLNYSGAVSALRHAYFGAGSGPIHYDEVACTGTETRLADCSHSGIGIHNCGHHEDAAVRCDTIPCEWITDKYGSVISICRIHFKTISILGVLLMQMGCGSLDDSAIQSKFERNLRIFTLKTN